MADLSEIFVELSVQQLLDLVEDKEVVLGLLRTERNPLEERVNEIDAAIAEIRATQNGKQKEK